MSIFNIARRAYLWFMSIIFPQKGILQTPVINIPGPGRNVLTWAELVHGVACTGNAGSGKSSGFMAWLMRGLLRHSHRPGGLFVCVKKDDRIQIERAIREAGREDDMIIISEGNPYKFNAIEYELFHSGTGRVEYNQTLDLLMEIFLLGENYKAGGASGGNQDRFWEDAMKRLLKRILMLLVLSGQKISVGNMRKVLVGSFNSDQVDAYFTLVGKLEDLESEDFPEAIEKINAWAGRNFFVKCIRAAILRDDLSDDEYADLELVHEYFFERLPDLSEKTKSIVVETALGLFESFLSGILKSHFSDTMSPEILPKNCYENGKLVVLDVPVTQYGISAIYAAGLVKKAYQLAADRRMIHPQDQEQMPWFFWLDEFSFTASATSDDRFQSRCRSTRTAVIYAFQSINNLKSAFGHKGGDTKTKSLLANIGTQIFCGNTCRDTNLHASDLIGKHFIDIEGRSQSEDKSGHSFNQQRHYWVDPEHFATLKSGGPENNFIVESIAFIRGKKWSTNEPFFEANWHQKGKGQKYH